MKIYRNLIFVGSPLILRQLLPARLLLLELLELLHVAQSFVLQDKRSVTEAP